MYQSQPHGTLFQSFTHISGLCRQRVAAEESAAEAARLAAEHDSMKNRALANMMDGTLRRKKADPLAGLVKEPWMSLPLKEMTPQQLKQLREFEKKVQVRMIPCPDILDLHCLEAKQHPLCCWGAPEEICLSIRLQEMQV
jgi:hypothetical protein